MGKHPILRSPLQTSRGTIIRLHLLVNSLNDDSSIAKCDIYDKERDSKDEATEYIVLSQLAPDDAQIQYGFGLFLSRQKEHSLAIQHFKRATQIDGSVTDYWVQLGNEYLEIRDYKNAEDAFQSAGPKYNPLLRIQDDIRQLQQPKQYNKRLKELPEGG